MQSHHARDLTDAQWAVLDPLIPEPRRRKADMTRRAEFRRPSPGSDPKKSTRRKWPRG